ncbi:MAG: hypothetical protein AAF763_10550 [Pseudomonadota bacterium]
MAKKIDESVLDEPLKGCERPEDLLTTSPAPVELMSAILRGSKG